MKIEKCSVHLSTFIFWGSIFALASVVIESTTPHVSVDNKILAQIYIGNTTSLDQTGDVTYIPADCSKLENLKMVTTSSDENLTGLHALFDNNLATYWSNNEIGSEIILDLGSESNICGVEVAWFSGNSRSYNFSISESSSESQPYRLLGFGFSKGNTQFPEYYSLGNELTRFVKVTIYGNTQNDYAGVSEIRLYAKQGA